MSSSHVINVFNDADEMYKQAIIQFRANDVRDAAEKAWCAIRAATDGLVMAYGIERPDRSPKTRISLQKIARMNEGDMILRQMVDFYLAAQTELHGDCFYLGIYEPQSLADQILKVDGYIAGAKERAYSLTFGEG